MSKRDIRRYELLQKVIEGAFSLHQVTEALGVSYRQAKRLKAQVEEEGLGGLLHGNRGRRPAHALDPELRARVVGLSQERYFDCNDTHFTELLRSAEQVVLSREVVRRWRREAGLPPKQRRRAPKHRKRRPRSEAEGLMILWDGSLHRWFGEQHPACSLLVAMDDATGQILAGFFCPAESSWAYLTLLGQVLEGWGVPRSVYQDCHSSLRRNDAHWSLQEELAGRQEPTQVGRAIEALGVQPIFALSPQAKGRVERLFRTLQDRLMVNLRLAGITTMGAGNAYLEAGFFAAYNEQFGEKPAQSQAVWGKAPSRPQRERVLCLRYPTRVRNDNTVRLHGLVLDLPPGPQRRSYAKAPVEVCQLLDGRWRVYHQEQLLVEAPATEIAELIRARPRRRRGPSAPEQTWVFSGAGLSRAELERLEDLRAGQPPAADYAPRPRGPIGGTRLG